MDGEGDRPLEGGPAGRERGSAPPSLGGSTPEQPLDGLLVVDLTRHLPGPLVARNLRDLGARVIKVEEPRKGDPVRQAPPLRAGRSALAAMLLAGLESVALDLKEEGGREVLDALLARCDVLLESFRPGTLERLGLPPAELRRRFPRLVVCSISGWGQEGPWSHRSGHDLTYQAVAGSLAPTGVIPSVPVADVTGAWSATSAVLAALLARAREGQGSWVDQGLLDAAVHANLTAWAAEASGPKEVGEALPLTGAVPCYELYRTRDDGLLALAALEPVFWQRICRAAGRKDLVRRQYDGSRKGRREVARLVASRTRDEWLDLLEAEDVPVAPVLSAREALAHPQMRARGVVRLEPGGFPHLAFPALFDGRRPASPGEAPELGAHTGAVLAELGSPLAQIGRRRLRSLGVGPRRGLRDRLRGWLMAFRS
jgi:alpha-methylacyl-CoA racemase